MTKLAEQLRKMAKFEPNEIAECRSKMGDQLSAIFKQKCLGYRLPKPELLRILFDEIITDRAKRVDEKGESKRPIVQLMQTIIRLAGRNHQPIRFNSWKENQESGYLGDMIK